MPKRILLLGAGRSASNLIKYLLENSQAFEWELTIVERSAEFVKKKIEGYSNACVIQPESDDVWKNEIPKHDLVISMLPARFHESVLRVCIESKTPAVTASYMTNEIEALTDQAKAAGIPIMMEVGVDPGIDHMSAMKLIDKIRSENGKMLLFESFTGGLIAPESDNNPWNYKFTWNPRNVVLAGQGGAAKFIQEGRNKYIPYHRLFRRTEFITIEGYGRFEGYANRDSLSYRAVYDLDDIPTIYRGTLRRPGFSRAWDAFVKLGATDDTYQIKGTEPMTNREFINSFLAYNPHDSVELKLMYYLNIPQDSEVMDKLSWLGIFEDTPIELDNATPAQVLQYILEQKWSLAPDDKDMIVMWHKLGWETASGEKKMMTSSMVVKGDDQTYTSMSKTVGLPTAIAAKMILEGKIFEPGIHRPIHKSIYEPILTELEDYGISFSEKEMIPEFYWKEPKER